MSRVRSEYPDARPYDRVRFREEPDEEDEEEDENDGKEDEDDDDQDDDGYSE